MENHDPRNEHGVMVINTVDRERGEGGRLPPRATSTISLAILTLRTLTINITEETGRVTRGKLKVNNSPLDYFLPPLSCQFHDLENWETRVNVQMCPASSFRLGTFRWHRYFQRIVLLG